MAFVRAQLRWHVHCMGDAIHVRATFASVVVGCVLVTSVAHADGPPEPSPKRQVPDYDGRGPDPSNTDGAGVWTARVLLSPLWLTSEFLLRRPLGAIVTAAEKAELPEKLYNFFAYGNDHKIGFFPIALVEFGFNPSVGVYLFVDDAVVKHNGLRLHAEMWPLDWFFGSFTDTYAFDPKRSLKFRVVGMHRPDQTFYGLGPSTLQSFQSRFAENLFDASATFEQHMWRSSMVAGGVGVRKVETYDGHYGDDPDVSHEAATGHIAKPYGFDREYVAPYSTLSIKLDTHRPDVRNGSGFAFEGFAEQGTDVHISPASGWLRYEATAGVTIDLNDHARLLGLKVGAIFADPTGNAPVPFTELVMLGGDRWMYGYFPGRLRGRSAAVARLSYSWPIAPKIEATMHASVGNVFGEHLQDFSPKLLRFSGALGIAAAVGDAPLEVLAGFGTETFERGAPIDSFRLMIGVPRSF